MSPSEVLAAAARGHLGLDHRFLHALLDRPDEAKAAAVAFTKRDRSDDVVDLMPELIVLFRHWKNPDAIPFLIDYLKEDPENVPDEIVETLVALGDGALEPLLKLYNELDESQAGEIAFMLASLGIRDQRIFDLLSERLAFDLSDTALLFETYGDPAAIPLLEKARAELSDTEIDLKGEIDTVIDSLRNPTSKGTVIAETDSFNIWSLFPQREDLPVDLLDEDEREQLLKHSSADVRAAAIRSFFNQELTAEQQKRILELAQGDSELKVRARAWETLINSTEDERVLQTMLGALRNSDIPMEERAGLVIGLAPEADRNEVRAAILEVYEQPALRAKALEAMWRSVHPSFREYFARHLDDSEVEVRRAAIWGVGYYGVKSELENLRQFFDDEELRADALFAYALALPGETSRARASSLLKRIEKDAKGLSEMEEELVKAALDERLLLAGKEPVFRSEED